MAAADCGEALGSVVPDCALHEEHGSADRFLERFGGCWYPGGPCRARTRLPGSRPSIMSPVLIGTGRPAADVAPAALASTFVTSIAGVATFTILAVALIAACIIAVAERPTAGSAIQVSSGPVDLMAII